MGLPHASRVLPGLWQGDETSARGARSLFSALALCAAELQPGAFLPSSLHGLAIVPCPLRDAPLAPGAFEAALAAGRRVALLRARGARVLVTCRMGLNRSGLVTALAVRELLGCSGAEAARAVMRARPGALGNPWFLARLRATPAPASPRVAEAWP